MHSLKYQPVNERADEKRACDNSYGAIAERKLSVAQQDVGHAIKADGIQDSRQDGAGIKKIPANAAVLSALGSNRPIIGVGEGHST